ncbi:MAG: aromatic-L-amino-acid/L-tryptophan decarboxylase [Acidimicrobiaceae bacterium]|jgi:aromatic-L-amino-acid decarboxylase
MKPDEFRRAGHEAIDWVADYLERVETFPVLSTVEPGQVRAKLPPHPPENGEPWPDILQDLDRIVLPGITHWQSPNFFGFFPANASGPAVLGDLVSSGLGVQGMLWATSPACTELETHVLDWLIELMDLPDAFRGNGVIQDSASSATLCAVLAARDRVSPTIERTKLRAYTSNQAHSSVEKGIRVAGLRADQLRLIDVDDAFALDPRALGDAIATDLGSGLVPFLVVATVGTTSSSAIDPVPEIVDIARRNNLWVHVDAAYAGSAAVVPELRSVVNAGLDGVDSWCFDPHKWLLTNFDCDVFYVRDRGALISSLSVLPEYLRNEASESGAVIDYRDWHVPLGRRFRALKLWFVLRHYGAIGLREHITRHVSSAQWLAAKVDDDERFERLAPADLSLVCFAHRDGDEASERLLQAVNASGNAFLTHTRLHDRYTIRVAVGATQTEHRHVEALWSLIDSYSRQ